MHVTIAYVILFLAWAKTGDIGIYLINSLAKYMYS